MPDPDLIKDHYSSLPDEKLLQLAEEEMRDLTPEALTLLKQEFRARGLSMSVFDPKEESQPDEEPKAIEGSYSSTNNADNAMMGLSYQEMMYPTREESTEEKKEIKYSAEELEILIQKSTGSMYKNGWIMAIGLAVTIFTFLAVSEKGGSYVVAWGAILFGGIGLFRAMEAKNKYRAALKELVDKKEY